MNPLRQLGAWVERRFLGGLGFGLGGMSYGQNGGLSGVSPAPVLSGVPVTPETALTFSAVFACINVRATDLASLPMSVKRWRGEGGRVAVRTDPRYNLVYCEPNADTTSIRFRTALYGHRLGWGNGYAEIARYRSGSMAGYPRELHLHSPRPMDTYPVRTRAGKLVYKVDGGRRELLPEDMIHVAGFGWDGLTGYSAIAMHRQGIGLGIAQQQFGAAFYGNSSVPKGALKIQKKLNAEGLRNLRESFDSVHQGTINAHRLMILEEGTDFQQISVNPVDAQYLASRQFEVVECCRMFRVPPPRIQDYTGVTGVYKAFADLIQDYISSTLGPDAEATEQEFNRKLFTARERAHGLHVAHDFNALLRGNLATLADCMTKRFKMASVSPDEVREAFGDNPMPGPVGNQFYVGTDVVPVEKSGEVKPAPAPAKPAAEPDGDEADDDEDEAKEPDEGKAEA